jgi:hypothetical protein
MRYRAALARRASQATGCPPTRATTAQVLVACRAFTRRAVGAVRVRPPACATSLAAAAAGARDAPESPKNMATPAHAAARAAAEVARTSALRPAGGRREASDNAPVISRRLTRTGAERGRNAHRRRRRCLVDASERQQTVRTISAARPTIARPGANITAPSATSRPRPTSLRRSWRRLRSRRRSPRGVAGSRARTSPGRGAA